MRISSAAAFRPWTSGFGSWGSRVKKTTLYAERSEEKRQEFLTEIATVDPRKIVYIDESGLEDTLHRDYARAPRGTQVVTDVKGKKAERISMIAGLLGKKLIAPLTFSGYTDSHVFNQWIEQCLLQELPPGHVVLMDRASFHRNPKTRQLIENAGCRLLYLPSYSPDFNKIENWWAVLKAHIKAILPDETSLTSAIETTIKNMQYHKKIC